MALPLKVNEGEDLNMHNEFGERVTALVNELLAQDDATIEQVLNAAFEEGRLYYLGIRSWDEVENLARKWRNILASKTSRRIGKWNENYEEQIREVFGIETDKVYELARLSADSSRQRYRWISAAEKVANMSEYELDLITEFTGSRKQNVIFLTRFLSRSDVETHYQRSFEGYGKVRYGKVRLRNLLTRQIDHSREKAKEVAFDEVE